MNREGCTVTRKQQTEEDVMIERLFKREYGRFNAFAEQLLDDPEQSRDIVADAFEYAWNHAHGRDEAQLRNLIFTVIRDRSIDYMRKKKVEQKYIDFYNTVTDMEDTNSVDERLAVVERAMATLPPKAQLILKEYYQMRYTHDEVAADMHISKTTVKVRLAEALHELRKKVKFFNER